MITGRKRLVMMASPPKSSRSRRLPSPKSKAMSVKNDDTFSKYITGPSQNAIEDSDTLEEIIGKLLIYYLKSIDKSQYKFI